MAAGAALAVVLAGCTDEEPGTPSAAIGTPEPTAPTPSSAPSPTARPADSIKPCSLLSAANVATLGITDGPQPSQIKGAVGCDWRVEKQSVGDGYAIGITVYPDRGLKNIASPGAKTPIVVGKHDAIQNTDTGCAIAIGVTDTSRVEVYVTGGRQTDLCKPALDTANIIEPKLP